MRIVFILQDTGKVYGAERATLDLAKGLAAAGHTPKFLLMEETRLSLPASDLRAALKQSALEFTPVRVDSRFSLSAVNDIRRNLVDDDIQIVHCVGYKADVHGGIATRWGKDWPLVSTVHGWLFRPDFKELFYGWINLHALRRCTRVIALSRHYEQMLRERGVARNRLVRIPSGLDLSAFRPASSLGGAFTIGIMGRLSSEKNHLMFLRAARMVLDAGAPAQFLIAGDGPERASVERQISDSGMSNQVRLAGFMERDDFFRQVHAAVLCSNMENLPYVILEAMAWSRPVVATNVGGLPDLIDEGVSGFLVPPDDHAQLADRIMQLAKDPALVRRMGEMGRYKVEAEFDADQMVAKHVELYGSLGST